MDVWFVDAEGIHRRGPEDVVELYGHEDGFHWIDVATWDDAAESLLRGLGCHQLLIEACRTRNYVPTVHGYEDHVFMTSQSPHLGDAGHVHLLELDQILAPTYLVTVHGPINPRWRWSTPWSRPPACASGSRAAASTRRRPPSSRTP